MKALRVAVLLFVLATVALSAWQKRTLTTQWTRTVDVVVYPINGDGHETTSAYIGRLNAAAFSPIVEFTRREAERYAVGLANPLSVKLGPLVNSIPPATPRNEAMLEIMLWSLRLRFWAWRNDSFAGPKPDVRVFAVYFDPAATPRLEHSVGLKEGLIGIARVFAASHMTEENNVIIAHEILHTFGATDKYDPATTQPVYPDGYASPGQSPLYPQEFAEIMGGRIPISQTRSEIPQALDFALVGEKTAAEVHWRR
ncbi:MAG: hypothetical protein ACJ8G2_00255 [Burkholderiales bacterium]|jgi:hypothetical protein